MLNKKILLGITGGIAAYKTAELIRLLRKANYELRVVMTKAAQQFITPLTIEALSENNVYTDTAEQESENTMNHIYLSRWADMIVIAPTTANFIAKMTYGLGDDLLSTLYLAKPKNTPIAIAPAMNKEMWLAEATQNNLNILKNRGVSIIGPDEGIQACGEYGFGRMSETDTILKFIQKNNISDVLSDRKILITAGPTLEPIDPVRYISNFSSGKMGYAVAEALATAGASVYLISGPTHLSPPINVKLIKVKTAKEMQKAVMQVVTDHDMFISVAAVSDYSIAYTSNQKIQKNAKSLNINLVLNPDILKTVTSLPSPPITIGFAAETENVIENAAKKLQNKKIDMIIANKVGQNIGFNSDENHLFILKKNSKKIIELKHEKKIILAKQLIPIFEELYLTNYKHHKTYTT